MKDIMKLMLIVFLSLIMLNACEKPGNREFETLYSSYRDIFSYQAPGYDDLIKKVDGLQFETRNYLENFPNAEKRTEVERILAEMKDLRTQIEQEQFDFLDLEKQFKPDYSLAESQAEIDEINDFIRKYPRSPKCGLLIERRDMLHFKNFQLETSFNPNTIIDLNRAVQISTNYLGQIQDETLKSQVKDKINQSESLRQTIYENEVRAKTEELIRQMRDKAIQVAQESHPFSKIVNIQESVNNNSLAPGQTLVTGEYSILMQGAIIGIHRYLVSIRAKGIIFGSLQGGVSYGSVTEINKVTDFRVN